MRGTEPSRAVAGSSAAGMDGRPTRSRTPWAAAGAGVATTASTASTKPPTLQDMEPLYQTAQLDVPWRGTRCSSFPHRRGRLRRAWGCSHGSPAPPLSWHQTCSILWQEHRGPSSHRGTGVDGRRLHLMRAIGGAEGTKWKKSNEFNSSEQSFGANSLDLFQTGPLY